MRGNTLGLPYASALMYTPGNDASVMNVPGRALAVRNTNQVDTKDKAHWYVATISAKMFGEPQYTSDATRVITTSARRWGPRL
jgi:hypothetical protein